jgi:putative Mn2+ efflux pump MntP
VNGGAKKAGLREMAIPGLYFGLFQALMPAAGFLLGSAFAERIAAFDHWIVFGLLTFLGALMIKESLEKPDAEKIANRKNPFGFLSMLVLAFATSVDAFAVGITFAFFNVNIFVASPVIGVTTCVISALGVKIGTLFGLKYKAKAELAGGLVLAGIGIKILAEHLLAG